MNLVFWYFFQFIFLLMLILDLIIIIKFNFLINYFIQIYLSRNQFSPLINNQIQIIKLFFCFNYYFTLIPFFKLSTQLSQIE
jgi:hypothetical protein